MLIGTSALADDVWTIPDPKKVPDDEMGRLIHRGAYVVEETYEIIGPEVADAAKRYAGNNLACASCHMLNGTVKFGFPLAGVSEPIEDKVNTCLVINMSGRPLPADAPEMTAIVAYVRFLGSQMTPAQAAAGRGVRPLAVAGNAAQGKAVFAEICAVCHSRNGLGKRTGVIGDAHGYRVPPLWGKDSFTGKSPLMRPEVLAGFIHNNMPDGASWDNPVLTPEDSANAAAYILTAPRPQKE